MNCVNAVKEFPVALSYLTLFAFIVAFPEFSYAESMTLGISCMLACLGSLAATIASDGQKRIYGIAGQVVALVLALLYLLVIDHSDFFQFNPRHNGNHLEISCSLSGYLMILAAIILFPFWRRGKHTIESSWSTTMTAFVGILRGSLVALCVLAAMSVITFAAELLLDFSIFGRFWLTFIPLLLFGALSIASFSKRGKTEGKIFRLAPFSRGVFTFVSIPLLAAYLLIFYLYLIKVAIDGTSPVRDLSYQAIGVFLAFSIQRYVFQQALTDGDNVIARWFNKISPWLLLLPVVMMSWVICQRLLNYGLTVNRLYILIFNLWMYGILAWWIITKARKVWVIPVSLCIVMSLSSITVVNVTSITEATMRSDLKAGMQAAGWSLPVTDSFYNKNSWSALTAGERSKKSYLEDEMGEESLRGIVSFQEPRQAERNMKSQSSSDDRVYISTRCFATFDSIPDGCLAVNFEDYDVKDISLVNDSVIICIGDLGALIFSMDNLRKTHDSRGGTDKIRLVGTTGDIKGGSISHLYINGDIAEGTFKGKTYSSLTGTIFLPKAVAKEFINNKDKL